MRRLACLALAVLALGLSGCMLFFGSNDEILYEETFTTPTTGAWPLGSFDTFARWMDGGKYYMLAMSNVYVTGYNPLEGPFGDVQIDIDVDHILGTPTQSAGGLIFRVTDGSNFYAFLVSAAGSFTVRKWVNGAQSTLLAWAESPAVNKGAARNHLTVIAQGSSLSFLVNRTEVAMLTDNSLSSGTVGVIEMAFDANVDVLQGFDNLVVQTAE
ncbi:MAG: hypothetical protein NTX69_03385 [Candidatus Bipolaricaulota bacterium]|nr:hypothetical protein [Candidatus Bipolaricaulota bacterium]